ncbi:MAG: hypothetical protein HDQ88_01980, partial [Clostridia bacterium]|nr:hypothetical protein [Clostridia bacterium]
MDKKKLARMIATAMACLGMGVFAFAGCDTGDNGKDDSEKTEADGGQLTPDDNNQSGSGNGQDGNGGQDGDGSSGEGDGGDSEGNGGGDEGSSGEGALDDAVIPEVPAGNVKITEAKGDLEAGYVKWTALNVADWYNVYVKPENGEYKKIDNELVRQYKSYFRADTVGLKAGKYTMKVVPTTENVESENLSATAEFTVLAHERSGFGFVNGTSS